MERHHSIGRRKTSIARVYLSVGSGNMTVNEKDYKTYFPTIRHQNVVNQAQEIINGAGQYDVVASVEGGGITGQAEAIRLAIARALCKANPENRPSLKAKGLLTRDPRMVERKKSGQKKARKRFQFSKR